MASLVKKIERPRELKWYHAGAMLYGDWGTSKAYVLGIAFSLAGGASWFFLGWMSVLTVLVGICYTIVCKHYPDGGGVYSSAKHRSQTIAVIGALILIAGFVVTISLSVIDAFHYFSVPNPKLWAICAIAVIGAINWIGPKNGGTLAAFIAVIASIVAIILFFFAVPSLPNFNFTIPHGGLFQNWAVFAGIVLALSGAESIANMTGLMVEPVAKTSRRAITPVMIEVAVLTFLLGVAMNAIPNLTGHAEDMLRALADYYVGDWYGRIISIAFGLLLLSAGNTAIMSLVSIQYALGKDRELPSIFYKLNRYGVPILPLLIATFIPILVLTIEKDIFHLASLYAIGVVGAITLNLATTASNFSLRMKLWERLLLGGVSFVTLLIEITIAIQKQNALFFILTILGVGLALRWTAKKAKLILPEPEMAAEVNLLTVAEAKELENLYKSSALVAIRSVNPVLLEEAALHAKARGENSIYLDYVEETVASADLPEEVTPSRESIEILSKAQAEVEKHGITAIPIWQFGQNPGKLIAQAAKRLGVKTVAMGATKRRALINLLRGDVLRALARDLRNDCHLLIIG